MDSLMTFDTTESNVMEAAVSDTRTEQVAEELSIRDHKPFIVKEEEQCLPVKDIIECDVTEKIQKRSVYGLCRCCLSLGRFESLDSCYQGKEIRSYADLLLFTLGVKISGRATRLICSECVPKLLQALAFRRQVLASERDFLRMSSKSSVFPVSLDMNKSTHETIEEDNYESDSTNSTNGAASTYDFSDTDDSVEAPMETLKDVVVPKNSTNSTPAIFCSDDDIQNNVMEFTEVSTPTQALAGPLGDITALTNTSPELRDRGMSSTPDGIDLVKLDIEETCDLNNDTLLNRVHPSPQTTVLENPVKEQTKAKSVKFISCELCNRKIKNITNHMLVHLTCRKCKLILPDINRKYEHFLTQPLTELTTCKGHVQLPSKTGSFIEFQEHKSDEKLFKCVKCKAKYVLKRSLEKHVRTKHLMCNVCEQTFDTILKLEEHEKKHSVDCTCEMTFENVCTQKNHVYKGHERFKVLLRCTMCKRKFTDALRRDNHIKYTHLTCNTCDQTFPTTQKRNEHVLEEHPIKCIKCGKHFGSLVTLNSHRSSAHAKCNICKDEMNRNQLDKHMVEFHGAPDIHCGACGKSFTSQNNLKIHQRCVHLAERDFPCPQCDYISFTKERLHKHMLVHGVGVRKYICKHCGKTFITRTHLTVHERIHTGDKRAVCKLCGEAFVQQASLKYHLEKRHPGDKY